MRTGRLGVFRISDTRISERRWADGNFFSGKRSRKEQNKIMAQQQELERIKSIIWRRKGWLLWPFISLTALAGVISLVLPNVYKSTATVLIENQQIPSSLVPSTVTTYAQERIQSIAQEVTSRSKVLKLVEKYDLVPDKPKSRLPKNWLIKSAVESHLKRSMLKSTKRTRTCRCF